MDSVALEGSQDGLTVPGPAASRPPWLPSGPCADLIADRDWSATPLGPLGSWPVSMRALLGTMLRAPSPMALLWGDRGLALYNDAYAAIIGARHPEALGRPILDTFPDFAELNARVLRTGFGGGTMSLREAELTLDRGLGPRPAWFDIDYLPAYGDDGRPAGVLASISEITDRVSAQRRSEEDEARLRALADNLPGALVYQLETSRDLTWRHYTYVSAKVEPLLGIPQEESTGDPRLWLRRLLPEDAARLDEAERVAARDLSVLDVEVRSLHPDGRIITGRIVSRPREAPGGGLIWDGMYLDVTAARAAEAELRRTATLLQGIGASTPDLVYAKDRESRFLYVNPAVEALTGRPAADLVGAEPATWAPDPAEVERIRLNDLRIMEAGEPVEFEEAFTGGDGVTRTFRTVKSPLRDATGAVIGLVGLSGDVSQERAAREELRQLNAHLEDRVAAALAERRLWAEVFEATGARISVLGRDRRLLAANRSVLDATEQAIGRRPRIGERLDEVFQDRPDLLGSSAALWDRALAGEAFSTLSEIDGTTLDLRFEPMRDGGGEIVAAIQFVSDVTERIRDQRRAEEAEAARRETDALYRAYFQNSADGLFLVRVHDDGGFSLEESNPAHRAMLSQLGFAPVTGRRFEEWVEPHVAARMNGNNRLVLESGQVLRLSESVSVGNQTTFLETVLVPVRDMAGTITRIVGSVRDRTAQVQAEEGLRQSQKLESLGSLTGGVAHDFNNLLTPIIASLDMLQRREVGDERMRRLVDGALQSAERAKTLVQRLLAFARRQPLQPVALDLGALIEGMADLVASTVGPRIRVEAAVEPGLPPVRADANQLELAILNLAVNARDAMPDGGCLRVEAALGTGGPAALPPDGRFVRLAVADTGTGMDEATLARAVEPFFSTKGVGRGTGLGLSMVHGLASQLGGALEIRSRPGEGTAVRLWLPVADEPAAQGRVQASPAPARRAGTVLLVDDEELVRASTAQMLAELGYEVTEASSAEEALRRLREGPAPDLVVTDHLMPGMTGTDLARTLRQGQDAPPILLISGYAEDRGIPVDLPRLTKPFRQAELAVALAGLGGDRRA